MEQKDSENKPLVPPRLSNIYENQPDRGTFSEPIVSADVKIVAQNNKQKSIILQILNLLPKQHILDNDVLKAIVVSPDNSFLSKHNHKLGIIYLSQKLFSNSYTAKRPFHRIDSISSVVELLTHEIGHSVEKNFFGDENKSFMKEFYWIYPLGRQQVSELAKRGYVSALTHFNNISSLDRATLQPGDSEDIKNKIMQKYPMQKKGKEIKISWYGGVGPKEDFAESYVQYIFNNKNLLSIENERYNWMKDNVFNDQEFDT